MALEKPLWAFAAARPVTGGATEPRFPHASCSDNGQTITGDDILVHSASDVRARDKATKPPDETRIEMIIITTPTAGRKGTTLLNSSVHK